MWDITPPTEQAWELRCVVWQTAEVPAQDALEELTDMYVVVRLGSELQSTDTHWRCATGRGSFNWRCVFPVTIRHRESVGERLTVQVWHQRARSPVP